MVPTKIAEDPFVCAYLNLQVLQKIMADPELAMSFSKPEVQAAIMDVTQNQMNITKYSNNPDIMAVFNKMSSLFQK